MMEVTGDKLLYNGVVIATIHEDKVSATMLADFIEDIRSEKPEPEEHGTDYRQGLADGADEHVMRIRELEEALRAFCRRVEDNSIRSTRTYKRFCELLGDDRDSCGRRLLTSVNTG